MSARARAAGRATEYLFVYGTLRPGAATPSARHLTDHAALRGAASVRGRLFHLGAYPGLVLDGDDDDSVPGEVFALGDAAAAAIVLAALDDYEGCGAGDPPPHAFARVRARARLDDGTSLETWLYEYRGALGAARRIACWPPPA